MQKVEPTLSEAAERAPWGDTVPDRSEQRELKRQVVLRTAAAAFVSKGFHKTSLATIAAELNINKATLYHYFSNKDEILYECHRQAIDSIIGDENTDWHHQTGALEELRMFVRRYMQMVTGVFGMTLVVIRTNQLEPDSRRKCNEGRRKIDHLLRDIIETGIAEGSFRACDPVVTAALIFGAMNWTCHWYDKQGNLDIEQLTDEAITFAVQALRSA
jgi:AcrR family transcriptional regulator